MTTKTLNNDIRKTAANMGFAIAGAPCYVDTFVQGGSSVLRMKFGASVKTNKLTKKIYNNDRR